MTISAPPIISIHNLDDVLSSLFLVVKILASTPNDESGLIGLSMANHRLVILFIGSGAAQ